MNKNGNHKVKDEKIIFFTKKIVQSAHTATREQREIEPKTNEIFLGKSLKRGNLEIWFCDETISSWIN